MLATLPRKAQRVAAHTVFPRHRHAEPYAAVVLGGTYVEAGPHGRLRVREGDVLFHDAFDAHRDAFGARGAKIVNIALDVAAPFAAGRLDDVDRFLRTGEIGLVARRDDERARDWPDLLCEDLRRDPSLSLGRWAQAHGLRRETLSRGFFAAYGIAPAGFRAEARAHAAWRSIRAGTTPLAHIATDIGFSDQAHMTRAVTLLTGRPPGAWRRG